MYRMNWKKNAVHTAEITGYTAEGMGVARLEGRVVFVPGTIRGERWTVRLEKVTKNVAWARGWSCWRPPRSGWSPTVPWRAGAAAASSGT